jgi:hypothetical protein
MKEDVGGKVVAVVRGQVGVAKHLGSRAESERERQVE